MGGMGNVAGPCKCRSCATCNQGSVGLGGVSLTISTTGYLLGKDPCVLQVLALGAVSIDEEEKLPFAVEFADDVGTLCRYCLL